MPYLQNTPHNLCARSSSGPWQGQWWPAGCGCPGTLWRAGYLRLLLPLLLLLWNLQVCLDQFISCQLSEAVTVWTTILKFYRGSKQRKTFPLLFGKILALEKRTTLHKGRKLLQLVIKYLLFHTCSGETFLFSWSQFLFSNEEWPN